MSTAFEAAMLRARVKSSMAHRANVDIYKPSISAPAGQGRKDLPINTEALRKRNRVSHETTTGATQRT